MISDFLINKVCLCCVFLGELNKTLVLDPINMLFSISRYNITWKLRTIILIFQIYVLKEELEEVVIESEKKLKL